MHRGKNENKVTKTEDEDKKETPVCTPKKFNNKYSYVYDTYEVCRKEGNEAFLHVADNINPDIFAYDCEEITDECGNKYYGVYFYVYNHEKSIEEKFYY